LVKIKVLFYLKLVYRHQGYNTWNG